MSQKQDKATEPTAPETSTGETAAAAATVAEGQAEPAAPAPDLKAEIQAMLAERGITDPAQAKAYLDAADALRKDLRKQVDSEAKQIKERKQKGFETLLAVLNDFEKERENNGLMFTDIGDPRSLRYVPNASLGERFVPMTRPARAEADTSERESLDADDLKAAGLTAFVSPDGTEAKHNGKTAHPAAYTKMRGAQLSECLAFDGSGSEKVTACPVALALQEANGGKPVARDNPNLVAHFGKPLSDAQAEKLAQGKLQHGDAARRAVVTYGLKDTENVAKMSDGTEQTVSAFIKAALAVKAAAGEETPTA